MYNGIKRKEHRRKPHIRYETKNMEISLEETQTNGIISKNYVAKIHDYKADNKIKWTDFEVNNLIAAGIDPKSYGETRLTPSIEKLSGIAETANNVMEQYEIIKELEQTKPQNEQQL